ncbi:hypothetical protein A0U93_12230 [Neoasaia chiangmaiensis]|uniref:Uncharacterized protein n=2 Tax=Neoasaia chiangmaiensis TaxID=320497 RepID=A0A1U9KS76_9PROT|nr:hypothetical protein A0U93_12230 [Neoasaia chiangmaiensis]
MSDVSSAFPPYALVPYAVTFKEWSTAGTGSAMQAAMARSLAWFRFLLAIARVIQSAYQCRAVGVGAGLRRNEGCWPECSSPAA